MKQIQLHQLFKPATSASQKTFNNFFEKDLFEINELEQEVVKLNFQKEVDEFQKLISANNYTEFNFFLD
jgi:hypothetical protein